MTFAEPLAFGFAALYGVLILFYLLERWRRRVVVPSLLLWQAVHEDTLRIRRFRPDLLFLLQLLVLSCLIVGLARPYLADPSGPHVRGRHIFVLDTTASMQTRERRGTRFEESRTQARARLQTLGSDEEVMVISAAHTPEVVLNFTRDHLAAARVLEELSPTDASGDLAVALSLADGARQRSDLPTSVEVFTDVPRSQLPMPLRDAVSVFQVGESDDNVGIEGLQIFQGRFQDYRAARASVLVENFAHRERHGFLTVRLEDQTVNRIGFTIPARDSKTFLVHDFPGPGRIVAQLEVADALAADNIAYGLIRPLAPLRVIVVSPASPLLDDLRDLAAATPILQLTVEAPDELRPEQLHAADLVILHRFVPDHPLLANALYIYPPSENRLFPVIGNAENLEVIDWNSRHTVLESLQPLPAWPLQRARVVSAPVWSQVLLWSRLGDREFPLALAGEVDGRRVACITFDLEAEHLLGTDNINFFLFFVNLLGWLSPAIDDIQVVRTGDVHALALLPPEPLRVQDPHRNVYTLPAGQAMLQPSFAGEYSISVDGTKRTLLANFFDPVESDIGRARNEPPNVAVARPVRHLPSLGSATAAAGDDYSAWLYAAAAGVLLIEWAARRRVE